MGDFVCARCGAAGPELDRAPFGGPEGARVRERVCAACFDAWKREQVRIINELRLDARVPGHVAHLMDEMRRYLRIEAEGSENA